MNCHELKPGDREEHEHDLHVMKGQYDHDSSDGGLEKMTTELELQWMKCGAELILRDITAAGWAELHASAIEEKKAELLQWVNDWTPDSVECGW